MTKRERPGWRRAIGPWATAGVLLVLWATLQFDLVNWAGLGQWARPQAPRIAVLLAAVGFAVVGGWAWRRAPTRAARTPGLSWWVVVVAAMVVAAVAWGATEWLLGEANGAADRGAARVDAIKTGLGIGAGTTAIFALLLAVRRQTHQEHTAADISFDAAEKRVTELYAKAVEQLGSGHAAVRLGGLYALERLAQGNPEHRQTIVNVLCAYLRMHYDIPGDPPDTTADKEIREGYREQVQEREVRLTAQRILHDHLEPSHPETLWEPINIDLTGARLIDFDLTNCRVHDARFARATFTGHIWFKEAIFTGDTLFSEATFTGHAQFTGATFTGHARFHGATFTDEAWFDKATFAGGAWFAGATFTGHARFVEATFTGDAWFFIADFLGDASFWQATWNGPSFLPPQLSSDPPVPKAVD